MRIGEAVAAGVERAAGAVRKLDSSLGRVGRALREAGADDETLRRVERARDASAGLASGAERAERAAGLGRGALRVWQERRDRIARAARKPDDLGGGRKAAGRRLDMSIGSVDELTALRDKARALWPEKKKEKEEKPKPPKTSAEKLEDLDKRREQALERLKGRREDERRRALSRDRLAAMAGRFGSLGG
jgi:hypothetical protein